MVSNYLNKVKNTVEKVRWLNNIITQIKSNKIMFGGNIKSKEFCFHIR